MASLFSGGEIAEYARGRDRCPCKSVGDVVVRTEMLVTHVLTIARACNVNIKQKSKKKQK